MDKKPNVILITIDALRADRLGFMGGSKNISPNLDTLAKESAVFKNAFAVGPGTPYSFPSILTSTYPLDYSGPGKIERPRVLISEVFKKENYITAAFHSSPYLSNFFGYNKGWDNYEDLCLPLDEVGFSDSGKIVNNKIGFLHLFKIFFVKLFLNITINICPFLFIFLSYLSHKFNFSPKRISKLKASSVNQIVKDFTLSIKTKENPFFIWVNYMDIHSPYLPYDFYFKERKLSFTEFIGKILPGLVLDHYASSNFIFKNFAKKYFKYSIKAYDDGIRYLDKQIGELIEFFKKEGCYENTIICVLADHGDEFLEHGGADHITDKLYNELLHVPFLIKIPKEKSQTINKKVSLIDLPSTLCGLVGIKSDESFKGKDLFSNEERCIFHQSGWSLSKDKVNKWIEISELKECKVACQFGNWKYILNHDTGEEELYDLSKDSKEKNNLYKLEKEILLQMRARLEEFERENPPFSIK